MLGAALTLAAAARPLVPAWAAAEPAWTELSPISCCRYDPGSNVQAKSVSARGRVSHRRVGSVTTLDTVRRVFVEVQGDEIVVTALGGFDAAYCKRPNQPRLLGGVAPIRRIMSCWLLRGVRRPFQAGAREAKLAQSQRRQPRQLRRWCLEPGLSDLKSGSHRSDLASDRRSLGRGRDFAVPFPERFFIHSLSFLTFCS
jgi:hypothetical protein